jgi:uncharacterized protein YdhG (YjbR/CyaY superfamily)
MTSKAPTVDAWMKEVAPERRETLAQVRALFRRILKGYEERMEHGAPVYARDGEVEIGFNSQKQHITVYVMKTELVEELRGELKASSIGKCCIRFSPKKVDFAGIERVLRRNVAS